MHNLVVQAFEILHQMTFADVVIFAIVENILLVLATLWLGNWIVRRYADRAVSAQPEPLTRAEALYALSCVSLNILITIVGLLLWQAGIIYVRFDITFGEVVVDLLVLFFAMDFLMYVFHRMAHLPWIYPIVHRTHHRYENPRPLTLFVLNPFEVLGFGILWLIVIVVYPFAWLSIVIYLVLNLLFGLMGHTGVEPFPQYWVRFPVFRYISTSTFHAEHHMDDEHNFGFYTLIWDRLFGTISLDYMQDFDTAVRGE